MVLATNRRMMSPATMPRTPPLGFLNAVRRPNLIASTTSLETVARARSCARRQNRIVSSSFSSNGRSERCRDPTRTLHLSARRGRQEVALWAEKGACVHPSRQNELQTHPPTHGEQRTTRRVEPAPQLGRLAVGCRPRRDGVSCASSLWLVLRTPDSSLTDRSTGLRRTKRIARATDTWGLRLLVLDGTATSVEEGGTISKCREEPPNLQPLELCRLRQGQTSSPPCTCPSRTSGQTS